MPYRLVWEDNPHDKTLPVLETLPPGVAAESKALGWQQEAHGRTADGVYRHYHYCPRCKGWIEGDYYTYPVNTLDGRQLAGRRGTCYACRRCGREIAFDGAMS